MLYSFPSMEIDETLFEVASYLTDPICLARESYIEAKVSQVSKKIFLYLAVVFFACLALFTTLPGCALRGVATWIRPQPFSIEAGDGKHCSENRFTLLSWNICCIAAGYSITDGGVPPWKERIDQLAQKIIEKNADVNCLYEVFDLKAAFYLKEKLKEGGYTHFAYNIGSQAIGVSSGMMVASKYQIDQPEFDPFPKETLVGRTQFCNKGVFSFDLVSDGRPFARIFSTHLQHSELPEFPTSDEVNARAAQMRIVAEKISKVRDRCLVLTGDLNLDEKEYEASSWRSSFARGNPIRNTWGGDEFCAKLEGKPISKALTLDYTLIWQGTAQGIVNSIVETGYSASDYRKEALSDHSGILSEIQLS
ncbi:MAG: endonuclease/exonuclease/phosphatase family protein [Parachlamydiales bacterium]|nr:endonuclease/exonuclease/phosphatase family protein [Parachlamydiales bacterium]